MESTTANNANTNPTVERRNPMARFSIGEEEEEEEDDVVPVTYKRPRLAESTSQSRVVTEEEENEVLIEDVESDSEGYDELEPDEDDADADADADADDDDEEEVETDDDDEEGEEEGVEVVCEQGQNNQQQLMTSSTAVFNDVNGELKVVLTDPDVLDCPICLDPLTTPVFQCENGHIACSSCCSKVKRKCPSCCMPIGYNRCRAIEKVIESVKVSCKNAQHGCKMTMTYSNKSEHEQICPFVTCFCPHPSCPFAGSSKKMYLHFGIQHAVSTTRFTYNTTFFVHVTTLQKRIFLQEQHESVIFILNHEVKEHGRSLSVDCVGPSTLKSRFEYQITARRLESTLSLQCVPDIYTRWSEHPLKKNYLTVPSDFFDCSGTLPIHICIKKVVSPV